MCSGYLTPEQPAKDSHTLPKCTIPEGAHAIKIPNLDYVPEGDLPKEQLLPVDPDTFFLRRWVMYFYGDGDLECGDDDEIVEIVDHLSDFWELRSEHFGYHKPRLHICGILTDHPNFPEGLEVDFTLRCLDRARTDYIEKFNFELDNFGYWPYVHDMLIATTTEGGRFCLYTDESEY